MKQLLIAALICLTACACSDRSKEEKAAAEIELYRNRERQEHVLLQENTSRHMVEHVLDMGDTAAAEYYMQRADSLRREFEILQMKERLIEQKIGQIEAEN